MMNRRLLLGGVLSTGFVLFQACAQISVLIQAPNFLGGYHPHVNTHDLESQKTPFVEATVPTTEGWLASGTPTGGRPDTGPDGRRN
ncbi:MAG: hypothetical protein AAGE59_26470 [Cyanobacteria bacterium P01_F01_bin.86]